MSHSRHHLIPSRQASEFSLVAASQHSISNLEEYQHVNLIISIAVLCTKIPYNGESCHSSISLDLDLQ
jgi:hypothetical protein